MALLWFAESNAKLQKYAMVTGRPESQQPTVLEAKFYFFFSLSTAFSYLGKIYTEGNKAR